MFDSLSIYKIYICYILFSEKHKITYIINNEF